MSEIKVNKISPATGTETTLGDASDDFLLPSGAEIIAQSGSTITVASGATIANAGTATGFGGGGKILKHAYSLYTGTTTTTSAFGFDSTIPQNTEGVELTTLAFTPTSASSVLMIDYWVSFARSVNDAGFMALFVDTTADALNFSAAQGNTNMYTMFGKHFLASGSTSARTYKLRTAVSAGGGGTTYVNTASGGQTFGATHNSGIAVTEIGS